MAFIFNNPGKVKVRNRVPDESDIIDISTEIWTWKDGGIRGSIRWEELTISDELKEILKAFIFFRFQTRSLFTLFHDVNLINNLKNSNLSTSFPWNETELLEFLILLEHEKKQDLISGFRSFYSWGLNRNINGFKKEIYHVLIGFKNTIRKPYSKIFLKPSYLSSEEESIILELIDNNVDDNDFISLRNNIILHLSFELGPRPIQLYSLDLNDIQKITSENNEDVFYSLFLSMAKKLSNTSIEKKPRSISQKLGIKIEKLIELNKTRFIIQSPALFRNLDYGKYHGDRLSRSDIGTIIIEQLRTVGFEKGDGATLLRHHLAQSLANQGASAEIIAEILGHNSTLPARAYIAATPEISVIKTKALGKSKTYNNIMKMLLTGDIIEKDMAAKSRWVKGMIGSQYIGGIGSCGLPENTSCPKNPVYSCYTCNKFHPFIDGPHEEVKSGLQKQAQYFVDIAEGAADLEHNRAVIQLERTIEAVDAIIVQCKDL